MLNSSREEKTVVLREIIGELRIQPAEKDLYYFSMEILNNQDFDVFFQKIISEFQPIQPLINTTL